MHQGKKIAGVFHTNPDNLAKIKEEEKEGGGGGFHISFFYSLKKSIVLRLTELCRRCKSWSNKLSVLLL